MVLGQEHYDVARGVQSTLQKYKELRDIIAILGMDEFSDGGCTACSSLLHLSDLQKQFSYSSLFIYLYFYLFDCLSFYTFEYLYFHPFVYLRIIVFECLYLYPFIYLRIFVGSSFYRQMIVHGLVCPYLFTAMLEVL